jgi:hypothetical protein
MEKPFIPLPLDTYFKAYLLDGKIYRVTYQTQLKHPASSWYAVRAIDAINCKRLLDRAIEQFREKYGKDAPVEYVDVKDLTHGRPHVINHQVSKEGDTLAPELRAPKPVSRLFNRNAR